MSISKLPFEITERITSYLDKEDFLQCMCVSFLWNISFRPFHYRSVELGDEHKCLAFFESLERSVKRVKTDRPVTPRIDDLGHYVHTFDIRESFMSVADTQKLARLCPNVKAVHFRWEEFSDASIFFGPQKRVYHSPTSFFDHFHPSSLTSLELSVTIPPQSLHAVLNTPSHSSKINFVVLHRFPQLQFLKLNYELDLEIAHLEHIHTICPKLKRLEINKPRLADCSIPGTIAPAHTMQHLALPSREWGHPRVCERIWFKYITHKYPALKSLNIVCTETYLRNTNQE
ncbi:hypothetical protein BJV82DRAFT_575543 [Fennellomyces sp. T-0311]|nr:hypothetical protein BJV82DRAFT_575543 [Fennellomyces sp. T-0311]